ncbi:unnamed protein product [Fraxinus pennsylvanica]|uniref:BTB domain-containing protein n=1 Tax=Fraxinus pennsylvanica TaxID=56036 RepID=A0AAD2DKJ5_9LAMI|nr:unnamed protein product [Fraxinus pennsylvanica]
MVQLQNQFLENSPFAGDGFMVAEDLPKPDVQIITSGGLSIPAHSRILASASPVVERLIARPQKRRSSDRKISILGVPYDAVTVFVQFLYSSKCDEEHMEKYAIHLLALSHVYFVPHLKKKCTRGLAERLTIENVVDVLQLARLCDAPDLYLKCLKLLSNNFNAVEETEGWKFLQNHDPWLELEILQFMDESESVQGKRSKKRVNGGCLRCQRMWQRSRVHSSIGDQADECRVPMCRQFKLKVQQDRKRDSAKWRLLVRKVVSAKTVSSLSLVKRKREEGPRVNTNYYGMRSFEQ